MSKKTFWARAVAVAAVATASMAVRGTESGLAGIWNCSFLESRNAFEARYYSVWRFDPEKKWLVVFWSPVHKGDAYYYRWREEKLVLDEPWGPPRPTVGTYRTRQQENGDVVIENPDARWKGWRCRRQTEVRWPADGLQFLDYRRYPWLGGLPEDGSSIERYRGSKR